MTTELELASFTTPSAAETCRPNKTTIGYYARKLILLAGPFVNKLDHRRHSVCIFRRDNSAIMHVAEDATFRLMRIGGVARV